MRAWGTVGSMLALAAALGSWAASGAAWLHSTTADDGTVTGSTLTGGLTTALALAAAVAVVAQLVFGRLGRRILGAVIAVIGGAMLAAALTTPIPASAAVAGTGRTWVYFAYLACGVLVAVGGIALAVWPGRPTRRAGERRSDDAWAVLDRGSDPTL